VPRIIVAGILDTKGKEIKFLAERVRCAGGDPVILELSVAKEVGWADISLSQILREVGHRVDEVSVIERAKASELIVGGAIPIVTRMLQGGEVQGIIAYGGSLGTSMATRIMRSLPIGFPKVMLSTMTSGDIGCYVGTRDISMLYPIAEAGLNMVTRKILNYAAAGIVGMASAPEINTLQEKPLIGCTMLGVTTPGVLRAARWFEERGYEVMIIHAVGSGGRSMEELITERCILGVLDFTTHEITDHLLGGVLNAGPDRLTSAGLSAIPQVISTGGLELIDFGPPSTVPAKLGDEASAGLKGRVIHTHNPSVTVVGITPDETFTIGQHIGMKLNLAQGPTAICIPLRGWGAYDLSEPNLNLGWAGPGPGPLWLPDHKKQDWSLRAKYFLEGLISKVDLERSNVDVLVIDRHINEPEFAVFTADLLYQMLSGTWKKSKATQASLAHLFTN
jgi:uncharacterized protein (UPF0261 family)